MLRALAAGRTPRARVTARRPGVPAPLLCHGGPRPLPRCLGAPRCAAPRRASTPDRGLLTRPDDEKEIIPFTFVDGGGKPKNVSGELGDTLLNIAQDFDLPVEGACGGECACSTCHVIMPEDLFDTLDKPGEDEADMLDLAADVTPTSRLGCQVRVTPAFKDAVIRLPRNVINFYD